MTMYYVNKNAQDNGDHEVHTSTCSHLPLPANRLYRRFGSAGGVGG
jgi:hypothetical protein